MFTNPTDYPSSQVKVIKCLEWKPTQRVKDLGQRALVKEAKMMSIRMPLLRIRKLLVLSRKMLLM
jgi:hypothetical protein